MSAGEILGACVAVFLLSAALGYGAYYYVNLPPTSLVLTGIVTTHDVEVSPQIGGRVVSMDVTEGSRITQGATIAMLDSTESVKSTYRTVGTGVRYEIGVGHELVELHDMCRYVAEQDREITGQRCDKIMLSGRA